MLEVMQSWWRTGILLTIVFAAHLVIIFSAYSPHSTTSSSTYRSQKEGKSALLTIAAFYDASPQPPERMSIEAVKTAPSVLPHRASLTELLDARTLETRSQVRKEYFADFLEANAVDEAAVPNIDFEMILQQTLPLTLAVLEIEFWIDSSGEVVQVKCIAEICIENLLDLDPLLRMRFTPAIKNGVAVASRKLIQIDPPATFGL